MRHFVLGRVLLVRLSIGFAERSLRFTVLLTFVHQMSKTWSRLWLAMRIKAGLVVWVALMLWNGSGRIVRWLGGEHTKEERLTRLFHWRPWWTAGKFFLCVFILFFYSTWLIVVFLSYFPLFIFQALFLACILWVSRSSERYQRSWLLHTFYKPSGRYCPSSTIRRERSYVQDGVLPCRRHLPRVAYSHENHFQSTVTETTTICKATRKP